MFGSLFHSYVLAQIFGLYMVISAIIMLGRASLYRRYIAQMQLESVTIWMSASFGLFLGIALVDVHNIWVWEPHIIVTVLAWVILIKSILWLAFPEFMLRKTQKFYSGAGYYFFVVVLLLVGILFMAKGFYHWTPTIEEQIEVVTEQFN